MFAFLQKLRMQLKLRTIGAPIVLLMVVITTTKFMYSTTSINHLQFAGHVLAENVTSLSVSASEKWNKFRPYTDNSRLRRPDFPSMDRSHLLYPGSVSPKLYDKDVYNIMNLSQIEFDPAYKNPCWIGRQNNGPIADGQFHCVPYFYLIGVKKSGTTDLHSRLSQHPEYAHPGFKESQWMPRIRWGISQGFYKHYGKSCKDKRSVTCYITLFDKAARQIYYHEHHRTHANKSSLITADCTPANLHIHKNWQWLPGNEGLLEPRYTNFHYLNHVSPNSKIIILFRDPVTRLFSDFLHSTKKRRHTPEVFHDHVVQLTHAYTDCFKRFPMRRCIYNGTIIKNLRQDHVNVAQSFTAGFYAFYMTELRNVFGSSRIHPVLFREYYEHMENTMNEIFDFLQMRKMQPLEMKRLLHQSVKNSAKKKGKYSKMLQKTEDLLYSFYEPYNNEMATLMDDERYLFPPTTPSR